jgi:molybdate transport system substrate-binding protein
MKFKSILVACLLTLSSVTVWAGEATIVAASDLKFAMDEIVKQFQKENPNDTLKVIYGSSGKFFTQIQNGAPYDMLFSADIHYPNELVKANLAASEVTPYALGRVVLWSASMDASKMTLANLTDAHITRIAIANPKHAPYGKRAQEALAASGVLDSIKSKLVFAENIAQTAQYVETANAQVGIIALSLALNPELASKGSYFLIPDSLHEPLNQAFVVTKRGEDNPLVKDFARYMQSKPARDVMNRYGFVLPN